ncbi:FGGY family carbohydrate kinase, partial [Eubacterium aggregans]|uniref:FGGY family carbohydrate kinase n=1 Tax=Eubacterium aggregans TaxID=81409 RepID=UPI003F39C988
VMGSYDLHTGKWYQEFLDFLGIPVDIYPVVEDDSGDFGVTEPEIFGTAIPITGVIADQHAALYAQGCRKQSACKITNGTGSFLDVNVGNKLTISDEGLNTVIAWKIGDDITYALEGYEDVTGSAVQWLRDGLQCIQTSAESETLARSVDSANGVYFVPALTGLSAPYHDPFALGTIFGITRGTTKAHIVRATLEWIAYLLRDILDVVEKESGVKMEQIRIDGEESKNDFLAQHMAYMLVAQVDRPFSVEATSLGAAEMAGLAVGLWQESDFDACLEIEKSFVPEMSAEQRESRYKDWKAAIQHSIGWMNRSV